MHFKQRLLIACGCNGMLDTMAAGLLKSADSDVCAVFVLSCVICVNSITVCSDMFNQLKINLLDCKRALSKSGLEQRPAALRWRD
jgi:hypothetical protein